MKVTSNPSAREMSGAAPFARWTPALLLAAACAGSGELTASVSGQIVGDDERPLGPGLILIERGPVHAGAYELGGHILSDGRFRVELPEGGTWGVHLFHSAYQYLPVGITLADHQQIVITNMMISWGSWLDLTGLPTWPDQPADTRLIRMPFDEKVEDNPTISNITFKYLSETLMEVSADAADPNENLSRMILAYDEATGGGYAMNPPPDKPPNDKGNYPNGTYSLKARIDKRHVPGTSKWFFVVSDNDCNNSPIVEVTMPPRS